MNIIICTIVCVLAAYGAFRLAAYFWSGAFAQADCGGVRSYILIDPRECEDEIEGVVRVMAHKCAPAELIVLGGECGDETDEILMRLGADFSNLRVMTRDQYIDYIK